MNEVNVTNPQQSGPEAQHPEEHQWAALLSETAQRTPLDSTVIPAVLEAIRLERERTADGSSWAQYLSSAAQLHPNDFDAVQPTLRALGLECRRVRQWRGSVTRLIATTAAVAAVVAAVAVFSPSLSADPSDAYSAYQEAARGW